MTKPTDPEVRPLHIAALAFPLIDFITPSAEDYDTGEAWLAQLRARIPEAAALPASLRNEAGAPGLVSLAEARTALDRFTRFWQEKHPVKGAKYTLDKTDAVQVAAWFETMLLAARTVNRAAASVDATARPLPIRHMGGTIVNKFHTIKAALGDRVCAHMLGALGQEDDSGNRARVLRDVIAHSQIDFRQLHHLALGPMAVSYVVPLGGDRVIFKTDLALDLSAHQPEIAAFAAHPRPDITPDVYFLEGIDCSDKKLGRESFATFAVAAMESGKPIVFSPPTDTEFTLGASLEAVTARSVMYALIDHPSTCLMTLNESEAVAMFLNESFAPTGGEPFRENPQLRAALVEISRRLARKAASASDHVEPLAFVSAGVEGAFYVSAHGYGFVPGEPVETVVSTLGAGDAFAAGVFVAYITERAKLLAQGQAQFSEALLKTITNCGQGLGRACVTVKGAQLPAAIIRHILNG